MPMARSKDLVDWTYTGDAFTDGTRRPGPRRTPPSGRRTSATSTARSGMYFTVTETTVTDGGDSAIGVATAPTPAGPWTTPTSRSSARAAPPADGDFLWTFDPARRHRPRRQADLYYGCYYGGISVAELERDGTRGGRRADTRVAIDNKFEGAYVVRRGGW